MAFEETREQQQMYNYFRSCIYIFLILEIVMNLPITADNRVTQFVLDLLGRFKVFNSVSGCKVAELVCICIVCIGQGGACTTHRRPNNSLSKNGHSPVSASGHQPLRTLPRRFRKKADARNPAWRLTWRETGNRRSASACRPVRMRLSKLTHTIG